MVTSGTPATCARRSSTDSRSSLSFFCLSATRSHLLTAITRARPSSDAMSAMVRSWCSRACSASTSTTTTSAKRMARTASLAASFSAASVMRALRLRPAVSKMRIGRSFHAKSVATASRVRPGSGPVIMRSSPSSALTSVDLPELGRPTMAMRIGCDLAAHLLLGCAAGVVRALALRLQGQGGEDRFAQVADALAVLGGDGNRLAEPQLERLVEAVGAGPSLALVGDQYDRPAGLPHRARESRIGRHHSIARIEQEQHCVGLGNGRLALRAHARGDGAGRGFLEARRVDEPQRVAADLGLALAPVAREARHVRDQRRTSCGQPVEERRLADVGPPDNGNGWRHLGSGAIADRRRSPSANWARLQLRAMSCALSVSTNMRPPATTGAM